jgi:hypothetical protein
MKRKSILIKLMLLILLSGCLDRLDFLGETEDGQLVVYGLLTDLGEGNKVQVSRTTQYAARTLPVQDATVLLHTEDNLTLPYFNIGDGSYELMFFNPVPGQRYSIEIRVAGEVYRSEWARMPLKNVQDELQFDFGFEEFRKQAVEPVFTVYANTVLPKDDQPIYLRWQVDETYFWQRTQLPCVGLCPPPPDPCFISDSFDPGRILLYDSPNTSGRSFSQVMGKRYVDNSFLYPFFVSVTQFSITPEAYAYWEKIKIMVNNQGGLFDTPPSRVSGNIHHVEDPEKQVLGYFEVAKANVTRFYTTRDDVPIFLTAPCQVFEGKRADEYASECLECEARAQGRKWSYQAPAWWKYD